MEMAEKTRNFSDEDVFRLLKYRIEFNAMFMGKRGTARPGWKMVADKLAMGLSDRHVAKKFANLVHLYNRFSALLKDDPTYEISWPMFNVMKQAITLLKAAKPQSSQIVDENLSFEDGGNDSDEQAENKGQDELSNDNNANKDTSEEGESFEENNENDKSGNKHFPTVWHRDLVMQLLNLRGEKYASYFEGKEKNSINRGWLKIHAKMHLEGMTEKQLRKKWQNMVHRYKCLNDGIKDGSQNEVSWQFYLPMRDIMSKIKCKYSPRRPLSRKSSNLALDERSPIASTSGSPSPAVSPSHHPHNINMPDGILEPLVTISLANEMLNQSTQRVTRGVYVKGKYARLANNGLDDSDDGDDNVENAPKRAKVKVNDDDVENMPKKVKMEQITNTNETDVPQKIKVEPMSNDLGNGHKYTSSFEYERERDRILFEQHNNMLKMVKLLVEKQGVRVPYDVTVDYSHI